MSRNSQIQIGRMGKAVRGRLPCDGHNNRSAHTFQLTRRRHKPRSRLMLRIPLAFARIPPTLRMSGCRLRFRIAAEVRHNKT
jgi:hypothetical protein